MLFFMRSVLPANVSKADTVKGEGAASVCWFMTAFCMQAPSNATGYHADSFPQKPLSRRKESFLCGLPISVPVVAHFPLSSTLPVG